MNFYLRKHSQDKEVLEKWDNIRPSGIDGHSYLTPIYMEKEMQSEMKKRKKAEWLGEWLRPDFTTSNNSGSGSRTSIEGVESSVLMMSTSTRSSDKIEPFLCANGIPSLTLLGEQKDW
jgi:hypothetical protein